jgi:hypothetical protein
MTDANKPRPIGRVPFVDGVRKVGTLVNNSRHEDPRCVHEADSQ